MKEKTISFFKHYGIYLIVATVVLVVGLTVLLATSGNSSNIIEEVTDPIGEIEAGGGGAVVEVPPVVETISYCLPLNEASVLGDYSGTELMLSTTLNQWQAHKYLELTSSASDNVLAVLDGKVSAVYSSFELGNIVVIDHENGTQTLYASLGDNVAVKTGDQIKKGDVLGVISESAQDELSLGKHLHFEMRENGQIVDPNVYLDLSTK